MRIKLIFIKEILEMISLLKAEDLHNFNFRFNNFLN